MEFGLLYIGVMVMVMFATLFAVLDKVKALDVRLVRMERLQQRLAEHEGMPVVSPDLEPVRVLLAGPDRKRIAAVKKYIDITGVGLAEAKDAVDRIDRGESS